MTKPMSLQVGCDFNQFKQYYEAIFEKLGETEQHLVIENPTHLIIWREDDQIIGHAIWHESSTEEHRPGDPRDQDDQEILEELLGKKSKLIELHEVWLTKKYRGRGYGKAFFAFFEEFTRQQGFRNIIYYAYHPAALAICRKRGYKEISGLKMRGIEGNWETMSVFLLP